MNELNPEFDLTVPAENQEQLDGVPIVENGEPLVDFLELSPRIVMAEKRVNPLFEFPFVHLVRKSVAEKLAQAAEALPPGMKLYVTEAYRPIIIQKAMYHRIVELVKTEHPDWSNDQVETEAGRRSAPPDVKTPPPHLTGAAVDLHIIDESGNALDFSSPYTIRDYRQSNIHTPEITDEAKQNRHLLQSVLEPTGMTQYVDEWWHWSYGDNGWALRTGAPNAIYGPMDLPPDAEWIGDTSKLPPE